MAKVKARPRPVAAAAAAAAADEAAMPLRERILCAAFAAFMANGYEGTSTLEIATRAKVSKRELYALFRSKQAMFAAGIADRVRRMTLPLELPPARDVQALERILVAFGTTLLREACRPEVVAVYRLAVIESGRSPELPQTLYATGREPNRLALVQFLARAKASGLIAGGEPATMAAQFLSLLWDDLMVQLLLRLAAPPDDAAATARAQTAARAFIALYEAGRPRAIAASS